MTAPKAAPVVAALGVTQIIGYGSLYYAFPILAPGIAAEFGVTQTAVYGVLSAGLLLGGLVAPTFGRLIDRLGAPRLMVRGSVAVAILLVALANAPLFALFVAVTILIEAISFAVLYDAAFATLAQRQPAHTRKSITQLTLIAGFASTLFWPLTGWLAEVLGWRGSYLLFAVFHLLIAAPLHLWIERRPAAVISPKPAFDSQTLSPPPLTGPAGRRAFVLLGVGFALTGMAIAALAVHLVPVLTGRGLGAAAYVIAMAMGPAQVLIRLADATFWRNVHPVVVAMLSAAAIPVAMAVLFLPGDGLILGVLFAVMFGAGQGLASIVRGSVPIALFGTAGIGLRLGRLAAIRSVLGAAAPFLFAWVTAVAGGAMALALTTGVAVAGLVATAALWAMVRRGVSADAVPTASLPQP
jgi:MFS family permease